jgi:hypothetical protein
MGDNIPKNKRPFMPPYKIPSYILLVLLTACQASDSVNNYENTDSAHGPRIDKEHLQAPPDTTTLPPKKRDSASLRVPPPGETDTTKLNIK